MKFKTHPHLSDRLWLSIEDMEKIKQGETLKISALNISLEVPDKTDFLYLYHDENVTCTSITAAPNLKLTFDGETGKLKSAEML